MRMGPFKLHNLCVRSPSKTLCVGDRCIGSLLEYEVCVGCISENFFRVKCVRLSPVSSYTADEPNSTELSLSV